MSGIWLILVILFALVMPAHSRTPDEWFLLTMELQHAMDRIGNEPDRRFIRKMINELTATDNAMPTPAQAHWLLSIKNELDRRK
jgi:hypothetical protein